MLSIRLRAAVLENDSAPSDLRTEPRCGIIGINAHCSVNAINDLDLNVDLPVRVVDTEIQLFY